MGVPLCRRVGGRVQLTEAGARYHARISGALIELASATAVARQTQQDGPLRVWCVPGFAAQWLADRIAEFEALYPQHRIEIRPTDAAADLTMLEADADIRFYGDHWPPQPGGRGLRCLELARPEIMAVASPELAAKLGALHDAAALFRAPLLHEEHSEQWRAWFRLNGLRLRETIPGPLLWHAHLAIAAARAGRGVALASTYLVGRDLDSGSLVELSFPGACRPVIGAYMFVAREDRWSMPAISRLRSFLQAKAQ